LSPPVAACDLHLATMRHA